MNKPNKKETLNLVLSAFLILGYIVCSYFFLTMSAGAPDLQAYINAVVFTVFGFVIFYATRIGEGVQVKRFSLATLLILDIPALYCIVASFVPQLPLADFITKLGGDTPLVYSPVVILACVALGYGIPYTFLSGYEEQIVAEDAEGTADFEAALDEFEAEGELVLYVNCGADDEGALLVVDDLDAECDEEKEIRQQFAITAEGVAEVGTFVKLTEAEACCCCCECEAETESETAQETTEE